MYKMNDKAYKINVVHAGISRGVGGVGKLWKGKPETMMVITTPWRNNNKAPITTVRIGGC